MLLILTISIIIYVIAGVMIYHNMYNYDKFSQIKLITIGFIVTLIVTVIICFISTSGMVANSKHISVARNTAILIFAPINAIISLPYIYNSLNKYKDKRIDKARVKKESCDIFNNFDFYIHIGSRIY